MWVSYACMQPDQINHVRMTIFHYSSEPNMAIAIVVH